MTFVKDPKQLDGFKTNDEFSYNCTKCGKFQKRKFRRSHVEVYRKLMCQQCYTLDTHGFVSPFEKKEYRDKAKKSMVDRYGAPTTMQSAVLRAKAEATNLAKYGNKCSLKNEEVAAKARESTLRSLGVEYALQNRHIYNMTRNAFEEKTGKRYSWEDEETRNKARQTMLDIYGVDNPMKSAEIRAKAEATNFIKYGAKNPMQSEEIIEKAKESNLALYGSTYILDNEEVKAKAKATLMAHYNVDHQWKSPEIREKIKQKLMSKYGVDNMLKHPDVIKRTRHMRLGRYTYDGIQFDSSWELALWIYATVNREPIERVEEPFEYTVDGKTHYYFPDFKYKGELVEIKGNHFISETGDMYNPYNHAEDALFKAKQQCAIDHGVRFMFKEDIQFAIDFVNNKIGKGFLKLWRTDPESFPYPEPSMIRNDIDLIRVFHKSIFHAKVKSCKYSPYEAWFDKDLVKRMVQNRIKYSPRKDKVSPESIIQAFTITRSAQKVSVFKPNVAIKIIEKYLNDAELIFDPFSGFSGRMLGAIRCGIPYIGQDINADHVRESNELLQFLINHGAHCEANVTHQDIFTSSGEYDTLFTCPPYADKEDWGNEDQKVLSCDEWIDLCLRKFLCRRYVFVVDKSEKYGDYVIDRLENKSHFGVNYESIVVIDNPFGMIKPVRTEELIVPFHPMCMIGLEYLWMSVNGYNPWNIMGRTFIEDGREYIEPDGDGISPFDLV